jgi:DNA-binding GntR family transcriptional regulator
LSGLYFSVISFANLRSLLLLFLLLIFTMDFEKAASYFSTLNPAFHRLMFSASKLHFLQQKLASQHSASVLSATIYFPLHAFAEGYRVAQGLTTLFAP